MRDLRSEIQNKVFKGLQKLGTVNIDAVYQQMDVPKYLDGVITPVVLTSTTIQLILSDYSASKSSSTDFLIDEVPIREYDKVAIFSTRLLAFTPSINDIIIDNELTKWIIKGVTGDPASAHYELHVRPKNNE